MQKKSVGVLVGLVVGGLGLAVVAGGGVLLWMWWSLRGGGLEEVARRLPADTSALWVARGFADLALEFRGLASLAEGPAPEGAQAFEDAFGFAPDDPEGWASTGLDFTRPWAVALHGADPERGELTLLLPVADPERVVQSAQRLITEELELTFTAATFGSHSGWLVGDAAALVVDDAHLILVGSPRSGYDAGTAMRVFLDRDLDESLWDSASLQGVLDAVDDDWHMFSWGSPALVQAAWEQADAELREVFGTLGQGGVGSTVTLRDEVLRGQSVFLSDAELPALLAGGADPLGERAGGAPVAVARLGLDWRATWAALRAQPELAERVDELARDLRDDWGVDVETDLVQNLGGPLTLVITPGEDTPGLSAWVKVQDEARAEGVLTAVSARLRDANLALSTDKAPGELWVHKDAAGVGVARQSLLLALGEGRLAALRAELGEGKGGYLQSMPAAAREELRNAPPVYAWLDVGGLLRVLGQTPESARWVGRELRQARLVLAGLSAGLAVEGRALRVQMAIYPAEGSFTGAAQRIAAEQAKVAEYQRVREQVLANVDALREAELAWLREHGEYLECGELRQARAAAVPELHWQPDACWQRLGFNPPAPVAGGYHVKTTGGWVSSFRATAYLDLDGDGEVAEITADPFRGARLSTDFEVY